MSFLILMATAFLITMPSSAIAWAWWRSKGRKVSLFQAPYLLMQEGPWLLKVALVSLNFTILAGGIAMFMNWQESGANGAGP